MKMILTSPTEFFQAAKADHLGDAFKYYAMVALIPMIIMLIVSLVAPELLFSSFATGMGGTGSMVGTSLIAGIFASIAFIMVLVGYVVSLVGTFIIAGIYHIIALIFGARKPYSETYKAFTYAATPFLLVGWISFLLYLIHLFAYLAAAVLFGLWSLVILIKGLSVMQNMSGTRAAIVVLLPAIIAFVLAFFSVLFFALGVMSTGPSYYVACSPCFSEFAYVDYYENGELIIRSGPRSIEGLTVSATPDSGQPVSVDVSSPNPGAIITISGIDTSPQDVTINLMYTLSSSGEQKSDTAMIHN
jgi:hypothetical protein